MQSPKYLSDEDKFNAIVNCDQNASSSFVFALKSSASYCRPTCQGHPPISSPADVSYFSSPDSAKQSGLKPCVVCNPDLPVEIDTSIIQQTVNTVNASLQLDISEKTDSNQSASPSSLSPESPVSAAPRPFRHNRSSSLATAYPQFQESNWRPRRASIANGHISAVAAAVEEISSGSPSRREERHRGEGDHARLVNEACMHIAAAAAAAAAQAVTSTKDQEPTKKGRNPARNSSTDRTKQMFKTQRKKRRGGILGFKELAAKAGLSPWHFHRVFRSVTGLTPKAYGDACWNTVTSSIPPSTLLAQNKSVKRMSPPPAVSPESIDPLASSPAPVTTTTPTTTATTTTTKANRLSSPPPEGPSLDISLSEQQVLPKVQAPVQAQPQAQPAPKPAHFTSPFDDHMSFDSNSLYSSQSLDSLASATSEDTHGLDSWTIPASYMTSSISMQDLDMLAGWDDKPLSMSDLMITDFKLEPMMNLGTTTPSTSGFYEMPATTTSTQPPVEEALRPKSRLQKVKTGLGEPMFDNPIGNTSLANSMAAGGLLTPTEPWMASPQPLLMESSDTVPPLFTWFSKFSCIYYWTFVFVSIYVRK